MANPVKGDIVLHNNGYTAQVADIGNTATHQGLVPLYLLTFLEGPIKGLNCRREEFTFPFDPDTREV